jgi:hypothetical protein
MSSPPVQSPPGELRIASLVPSLTELAIELGLAGQLVARTGYCVHPADAVRTIPKVGGTKDVNLAKLQRLAPTHVLVNVDENRLETVETIRRWPIATRPELVVTHPRCPEDNLALIDQMTASFAGAPHAAAVAARAATLRRAIEEELAQTKAHAWRLRRVLYLIWRDPWMTVARDTYLSGMLALVGWETWPAVEGGLTGAARYPALAGDERWLADVDLVLLSSEPYRFSASHLAEAGALCPSAEVRLVDGELLSWYGARALPGLRYLRKIAGDNAAWSAASR